MPLLKSSDGLVKCEICDNLAEFECAICHNKFCNYHTRFGRLYGYEISKKNEYYCLACWRIERNNIRKYSISKLKFFQGLKELNISQGNNILVQSSVSAFGSIEDGAETIIDLLLIAVGKTGSIIMPTFTPNVKSFHPRSSRADKICGVLPELFRKRKGIARSNNMYLSFAASGKNAVYFINNAIKYERLDQLSPIQRLMNKNGKILLLGVEFNNCLAIQFAEIIHSKYNYHSCGKKYQTLETEIKNLKSYKEKMIGQALCRIFEISEIVELISNILKKSPNYFNCFQPQCKLCEKMNKVNTLLFERNILRKKK